MAPCPCCRILAPRPVPVCDSDHLASCTTTVLDHYTSSFHWANTNVGAVWLRPLWYLVSNSAITDVQNGGLTFVTGGGYSHADEIYGHWSIARNDVFIGNAQKMDDNAYTSNGGPFNPSAAAYIQCEKQTDSKPQAAYCLEKAQGISLPRSNFANNQRLFYIYDGPAYQENNGYLDITTTSLDDCKPNASGAPCADSKWMNASSIGVPRDPRNPTADFPCYLPNAAIAWKQPNGFYYPPAFHSNNLSFDNVDIRHFVIEPQKGADFSATYCTWSNLMFGPDWTDVDRQTELSDDDGSLTGLKQTVSVNEDPFFRAPNETQECLSGLGTVPGSATLGTAKSSPYDYLSTVEYPECGPTCPKRNWQVQCSLSGCYGVPLYRQDLTAADANTAPMIRMAGQNTAQRSTLTVNHGTYYLDTTVTGDDQGGFGDRGSNVFLANDTYYTFLLFAKSNTLQTYQMYVGGEGAAKDFDVDKDVALVRVDIGPATPLFKPQPGSPLWGMGPQHWQKVYDPATGILTVTMDMSGAEFQKEYTDEKSNLCQPPGYCAKDGNTGACGCSSSYMGDDLARKQCSDVCSKWAGNDPPCPDGGCYGFSITLPASFKTGNHVRPQAQCFPQSDTYWSNPFELYQPFNPLDACLYKSDQVPQPDFSCTMPRRRR